MSIAPLSIITKRLESPLERDAAIQFFSFIVQYVRIKNGIQIQSMENLNNLTLKYEIDTYINASIRLYISGMGLNYNGLSIQTPIHLRVQGHKNLIKQKTLFDNAIYLNIELTEIMGQGIF